MVIIYLLSSVFRVIYRIPKTQGGIKMDKKGIIKALEAHLGVKSTYLGTPSFAYEIKAGEEIYNIGRTGDITDKGGYVLELENILHPKVAEVIEPIDSYEELIDGFEVEFPFDGHSGTTLRNLVNMISSKQRLIMQAFSANGKFVDESFTEILNQEEADSIEQFKEAYLKCRPERCPGIEFDFENETVIFRLDAQNLDKVKIDTFINLAVLINKNAKKQKYASFRPAQEENPKYALRTWLIRLGMNGEEYKASRKALLAGLEGSSAFRKPREETDKHEASL
ncbi:MAG: hypothetical protein AB9888_08170 [Bacteroidales bacterium]